MMKYDRMIKSENDDVYDDVTYVVVALGYTMNFSLMVSFKN